MDARAATWAQEIEALSALLAEEAALLDLRRSQLSSLSWAILDRYEDAVGRILDQIEREYGVVLNGDTLSPEELLEINALLRLKRSDEPVDYILNRFPGVLAPETPS